MLVRTADRVEQNTDAAINDRIRFQTEARLAHLSTAGAAAINQRLRELDREWDIERCLETMAPALTLTGIALGLTKHRNWFLLPIVVQGFFLQHAIQGWCPPIPTLRRLGVRTMAEIDEERYALKALRGDFRDMPGPIGLASGAGAEEAIQAVRK